LMVLSSRVTRPMASYVYVLVAVELETERRRPIPLVPWS
jgi:hypothetical protein